MADTLSKNLVNQMRDAAETLDNAASKIPSLIEQIREEAKLLGVKKLDDALVKLEALLSEEGYAQDLKSTGETLATVADATEVSLKATGGEE